MDRIFLGWGPRPLQRAARALVDRMGEESGDWWYVLPGRRAVRQFEAELARVLPSHLEPPRGIGQGAWLDAFRPVNRVGISRRESIHAWSNVLKSLSAGELKLAFAVDRPAPDAAGAWWALGQRARDLHTEICQAGLEFGALAEQLPTQSARWRLWSSMQAGYLTMLRAQGVSDGLADRASAPVLEGAKLAFIGVPTASALERRTLSELGARFVALILAPEDGATGRDDAALPAFDSFGLLNPEAWSEAHVPLPLEAWFVQSDPADQSRRACQVIREWNSEGGLGARDVVLAAPDEEVRPFLERSLQRVGLLARDAAGSPLEASPPARLVQALARMLPDLRFTDVASVLRHADMESALRGPSASPDKNAMDAVACLDAYHEGHLPRHFRDPLNRGLHQSKPMPEIWSAVLNGLGELTEGAERPLAAWCGPLRDFLGWVYGEREFSDAHPQGRISAACLRALAEVLNGWESGTKPWLPVTSASGALTLWAAELVGQSLPPLGQGDGQELEMLGWHELLWDDSKAIVLTGFNEGHVPENVPIDMLLPGPVRRTLGLPDEALLAARDVYLASALIHTKQHFAAIGGRHSLVGDPLRPSRLAFHRPDGEIPAALQHAFPTTPESQRGAPGEESVPVRSLPMLTQTPELTRMSATDFKAYLDSPYLYYVDRLLKLETVSDRERELNPANFGSLVHHVLERFGLSDLRHSTDPGAIQSELERILMARANQLFGAAAIPSVHLQVQGLKRRLSWFADVQAARAADGWRIAHVEWKSESGGVAFGPAGQEIELVGVIDRIDVHPLHGFAILDYKTGDKSDKPGPHHRNKKGVWSNLQLPMYALLARELTGDKPVQLGYFNVGKEPSLVRVDMASWDSADLEEAYKVGRDVIQKIRAGRFEHNAKAKTYSPVMAALVGDTLVGDASLGEETLDGEEL